MVVFGRIGTKGQSVIKSLETPEQAARSVAKLTLEQVNKGYVELSDPHRKSTRPVRGNHRKHWQTPSDRSTLLAKQTRGVVANAPSWTS